MERVMSEGTEGGGALQGGFAKGGGNVAPRKTFTV